MIEVAAVLGMFPNRSRFYFLSLKNYTSLACRFNYFDLRVSLFMCTTQTPIQVWFSFV